MAQSGTADPAATADATTIEPAGRAGGRHARPPQKRTGDRHGRHHREGAGGFDDPAWRRAALTALSVWGAAALAYLVVNCLVWMPRLEPGPQAADLLSVWDRFDTRHYVTIATSGYDTTTENPAFFPLYPLVIRILNPVLPGGALPAGLIISSVACVVALAVLDRLAEDLFGEAVARRTALYLMAYPYAFFLCAVYNESLFLMLMVASLWCMRRGQWWSAGILGALASGTRQAGVLLVLAFAVEYLRQRGVRPTGWRATPWPSCWCPAVRSTRCTAGGPWATR